MTTILRMHRSLEPYAAKLEHTIADYESRAWVDFSFHLAVMTEAHLTELASYVELFGVTSFKLFTAYKRDMPRSANLQGVDDGMLLDCLERLAELGGRALVHCENQEINDRRLVMRPPDADGLAAWAATRPPVSEAEAMLRVGFLASLVGCPLYLVHCSSAMALEVASDLRLRHPDLAVETIIHYLTYTMQSDVGILAKVAPPLRGPEDGEALWNGIAASTIQTVGSDHVPYTRAVKLGPDVWDTRLGIPGTGLILPVLLSEGVGKGWISLPQLVQLTAENPARLFGLERKGRIAPDMDADLVVIDRDLERVADAAHLYGVSDWSLYDGITLRGWPLTTISRGRVIVSDRQPVGDGGHGRFIRRRSLHDTRRRITAS